MRFTRCLEIHYHEIFKAHGIRVDSSDKVGRRGGVVLDYGRLEVLFVSFSDNSRGASANKQLNSYN